MAQTPEERRKAQKATARAVKKGKLTKSKIGAKAREVASSAKNHLSDKQFGSTKSAGSAPAKFDDRGGRAGRNISGTTPPAAPYKGPAPAYKGKHRGASDSNKDMAGVIRNGSVAYGKHAKSL